VELDFTIVLKALCLHRS